MTQYIEFRVFIGPRHLPTTDPMHYDWSGYDFGATLTSSFSSVLTSTLSSGATSLSAALGGTWGDTGGAWIKGNGVGQGLEYVGYTGNTGSSLTGLDREDTAYREHNGIHTSGAELYFWYELTDNNGELHLIRDFENEMLSASRWRATLSGFNVPQSAMRNNHMAMISYREAQSGFWKLLALGFTDSGKMRNDYKNLGTWELNIASSHMLLEHQEIKGVTVGDLDMAQFGSADSSVVLGSAFKERHTGDYVASEPTFVAKNVLNPDKNLIWIADRVVGTVNTPPVAGTYDGISQVYCNPHPGRGDNYKYVELVNEDGNGKNIYVYDPVANADFHFAWPGTLVPETFTYVILTDDPYTFALENPAYEGDAIINVKALDDPHANEWFTHVNYAGGCMALETNGDYHKGIYWGTDSHYNMWSPTNPDSSHPRGDEGAPSWGTSIDFQREALAAPDYGETMRRLHYAFPVAQDGESPPRDYTATGWAVDHNDSPGYRINEDGDDSWLAVFMPNLGVFLSATYYPGETQIELVDGNGDFSTEGLPNTGTIQIGDQQYSYTGKVSYGITLDGGGTTETHAEGDAIYVVENGVAVNAHQISESLCRYIPNGGYGFDKVKISWSRKIARTPDLSEHEDDYTGSFGGTVTYTFGPDPTSKIDRNLLTMNWTTLTGGPVRIKTLLFEFIDGEQNHQRPRVNRVECLINKANYDTTFWLSEGTTTEEAVKTMLINGHLPPDACFWESGGNVPEGFTTAVDKAWNVVSDFCAFAGAFADVALDSKIVVRHEDLYSTAIGGYSSDYSYTSSNIRAAEMVYERGSPVSQVKMLYVTPDTEEEATVRVPSTADWEGSVLEMGPMMYADVDAATTAATNFYYMSKYPYTVIIELLAGDLTVKPGHIVDLTYKFEHDSTNELTLSRDYVVIGVDHAISNKILTTVLSCKQINRPVEF